MNNPLVQRAEKFIEDAKKKHGNKFDYSRVLEQYTTQKTPVEIFCTAHSVWFKQCPDHHRQGMECPQCAIDKMSAAQKKRVYVKKEKPKKEKKVYNTQWFLEQVKLKLGEVEDAFEKVKYVGSKNKIEVYCNKHEEYYFTYPHNYLKGHRCPKCGKEASEAAKKKPNDVFIQQLKDKYGDRFDYSLVEFTGSHNTVKLICKEHGIFERGAGNLLQRENYCPTCSSDSRRNTTEQFIEKARSIHGDKYDYSLVDYYANNRHVKIICPTHGVFEQLAGGHVLQNCGCPKCGGYISKGENEIYQFINSHIQTKQTDRKSLGGVELDMTIKSKNIAFEYNGLYWHSDAKKENNYHMNKTKLGIEKGVDVYHIFEDEWRDKKEIVKSKVLSILGLNPFKIYARQTEIKEVPSKEAMNFLEQNHLQGQLGSKVKLGLYYKNELVSLMTFGELRKNLGQNKKEDCWELLRFCNKLNTHVVGAASKLLKYFENNYSPKEVVSYADRRWSKGNLYEVLGFEFIHLSEPNYFYVKNNQRENRFKYRKDILVKEGYDKNKSEKEIMSERGYNRIYDCGALKYIKRY